MVQGVKEGIPLFGETLSFTMYSIAIVPISVVY